VCQWHVPTTGEGIKKKGKGNEKPELSSFINF
jgi:hypothetical protein